MTDQTDRRRMGVDIYDPDEPFGLRVIGFFFGCANHGVVRHPELALMDIQKCVLRSHHRGLHQYPSPWVSARALWP